MILKTINNLNHILIVSKKITTYSNKISLNDLIFSSLKYNFSNLRSSNRQSSQSLLKQYFSSRLSSSTMQLERYLIDLSKNNDVKIRDHRWQSLYMTIEKFHKDFSIESKIQISTFFLVHALGRMKQNNALYLTLYRDIVSELHKLSTQQIAILLWTMIKVQQNDKNVLIAIYKKLYKIIQENEKIKLYKQSQPLPFKNLQNQSLNDNQHIIIHHMRETSFIHLIWALQSTKIIDDKLILDILKHVLQDKQNNNLQKIRIQDLALLAHCIEQLQFEKYRISQTIYNQIMQSWQQLQKLSILSLVLLCQSFSKFVCYQQNYLKKYNKNFTPQQIQKKQQFVVKQKKFIFLIVETIFFRQDFNKKNTKNQQKKKQQTFLQEEQELIQLKNPLSNKFASQIIFNLARVNLYDRKIWYKLLTSITNNVDQAQVQDLSMTLTAICNIDSKQIPQEDMKQIIFEHKSILCKRVFQIYTSLSGKSLQVIKQLVFQRKLQNSLVPPRVRKQVEKQFMNIKVKQEQSRQKSYNEKNQQNNQQKNNGQKNQKVRNQQRLNKKGSTKQYQQVKSENLS